MCSICMLSPFSRVDGTHEVVAAATQLLADETAPAFAPLNGGGSGLREIKTVTRDTDSSDADQYIDGLLGTTQWNVDQSNVISYSFPDAASDFNYLQEEHGFAAAFTPGQIALVQAALTEVAQFTNLQFDYLGDDPGEDNKDGTLRFYGTQLTESGFAYSPAAGEFGGDSALNLFLTDGQPGDYAAFTAAHEVGHALGLEHGHEQTPWGALPAATDSNEYSIMTYRYFVGGSVDGPEQIRSGNYAQTFMQYDIAALQTLYGAKYDETPVDTVYTFDRNTSEMFINGVGQTAPADNVVFRTIWDGGGQDTYDLSNYGTSLLIDLMPGAFSDFFPTLNYRRAQLSIADQDTGTSDVFARGHFANALLFEDDPRSLIENATAGSGNDVLRGNRADNILLGGDGADTLWGGDGGDRLEEGLGVGRLFGGNGADWLSAGLEENFYVDPGTADLLVGDAIDTSLTPEEAGQIYRLYQATLNRAADVKGHQNWTEQLLSKQSTLEEITNGFVRSAEFQTTYGALDNSAFVTLLYENVLERAPDATGLSNWTARLENGTARTQVVLGFSESAEFRINIQPRINIFLNRDTVADWSDDVFRLYQATLDRAPDLTGFLNWATRLGEGRTMLSVVDDFVGSVEFQNTYGALDNAQFVNQLYRNVLDREADSTGLTNWTQRLDEGTARAEVVFGFSQSAEFISQTAAPLKAWVRAQGRDDVLESGSAMTTLSGGLLSDVFVIAQSDQADHRITDLEAWDFLDFSAGFGYDDAAGALAQFTQQGEDVVFEDQTTRVVLEETSLANLTEDMIIV